MQGNWTVCETLKYLILMPDIQEAKCFEFTVQILPPPLNPLSSRKKLLIFFIYYIVVTYLKLFQQMIINHFIIYQI